VELERFIEVLKNYSNCSEREALKVLDLKDNFPYCQLLHSLSARLSKDHGLVDQAHELQIAAVYAADRAVLKDVMTLDNIVVEARYKAVNKVIKQKVVSKPTSLPAQSVPVETELATIAIQAEEEVHEEGSMAEQVMTDLERLHELKHNFEMMFVDGDAGKLNIQTEKPVEIPAPQVQVQASESTEDVLQANKSKRARIIELAKALEASKKNEAAEEANVAPVKVKKSNPAENIIEEIVSIKHEIEPENPNQKEQLEIIEQFIKTQPTISNSKDKPIPPPGEDLTTIRTGEFSDNIVSETLVEILLKQGKKDKAIEVLKKLVWKFPQKKAYFAAQIEELKK
jgi:hypothetical protein